MTVQSTGDSPVENVRDVHETTCAVVGGGPAGALLSLLLARRGIPVVLLEAHDTFDREFRADTLHPAILEILEQIGLAEPLHVLPHVKLTGPVIPTARGPFKPFDLGRLKTKFPYVMVLYQPLFLEFLMAEARKYPNFQLRMGASVQRLVEEQGNVCGVRYRADDGWHEVRALLTVGCDGRFSRLRHLAGFEPIQTSPTLELMWFRLPHLDGDPGETALLQEAAEQQAQVSPRLGQRRLMVIMNRLEHWQLGYFFPPGEYRQIKEAGLDIMRHSIVTLEPRFATHVRHLTDWQQLALLSVASSCCRRWYKPGLLLIGDAAHTMTPAAGAGIKYAVEDAVVAANVLVEPLRTGRVELSHLARVQKQREWPTRMIQFLSAFAVKQILRLIRQGSAPRLLWIARVLSHTPILKWLLPRIVAIGFWRVRVEE